MNEMLTQSAYFGASVSLIAYFGGVWLKKKLKSGLVNPLLIAIIVTVIVLVAGRIDYQTYNSGAKYISWLLTPATICLALPLYEQFEVLKKNALAVVCGILSGVIMSIICIFLLSLVLGFSHAEYVTFLPKSITTAIGMGVSEELGGYVTLTVACIVVAGNFGFMVAGKVLDIFGIEEPIAKGLALGNASHAIGTVRALQFGMTEGAMGGLALALAGLMTVALAPIFATLL